MVCANHFLTSLTPDGMILSTAKNRTVCEVDGKERSGFFFTPSSDKARFYFTCVFVSGFYLLADQHRTVFNRHVRTVRHAHKSTGREALIQQDDAVFAHRRHVFCRLNQVAHVVNATTVGSIEFEKIWMVYVVLAVVAFTTRIMRLGVAVAAIEIPSNHARSRGLANATIPSNHKHWWYATGGKHAANLRHDCVLTYQVIQRLRTKAIGQRFKIEFFILLLVRI